MADAAGNVAAAQTIGAFQVALETTPPTAAVTAVSPSPRNTPVNGLTIVFSEPVSGFDLADLALTRDGGGNLLTAGQTLTTADGVTFTLGNLAGVTGAAGNYTLAVAGAGSGVTDPAGNALAAGAAATFAVDLTGPAATASAADVTTAGAAAGVFTVTYADAGGVNASTLDSSDVLVTGPDGYQAAAAFRSAQASPDGAVYTAAYAAPAPAGGWTYLANGTYTIALQPGQVADAAGNFATGGAIGSFEAALEAPPAVSIAAVSPNPRTAPVDSVAVAFTEPITGFDAADLSLVRDGAVVDLPGLTVTSDDGMAYTVAGLGGATSAAGDYMLVLAGPGSGIADLSGDPLGAGTYTQFTVTAPCRRSSPGSRPSLPRARRRSTPLPSRSAGR